MAGSALAGPIADYTTDFVVGSYGQTRAAASADGWNLLWNSGGAIGTASNYTSMFSNAFDYLPNPTAYPDIPNPDAWLFLSGTGTGGNTGSTPTDYGAGEYRYNIAAYTIQTGEAGDLSIANSSFNVPSLATELVKVYVNDTFKFQLSGTSGNFNGSLGTLSVGDTVYVAVGGGAVGQSYNIAYQIVPEPATWALLAGSLTTIMVFRRRRTV